MCDECGCDEKKEIKIHVDRPVTEVNDKIAHEIWHMLKKQGILCINLMGGPGSGKTTVIKAISGHIDKKDIAVIQGDLESDIDKKRLEEEGIHAYQINTHSGCHLNASMIQNALIEMDFSRRKYLIIENVGNLVCPAKVAVGQHMNMVVSSTTEGSDKPKKYPIIFMDAALVIISKSDLAELVDFNEQQYIKDIKNINNKVKIVKTSSKDPDSFREAADFIVRERERLLKGCVDSEKRAV